jgi:hypothetical protein
MPHASLKLISGVDQNRTEALNEAAIWESNLIRFVPDRQGMGLPQKLGGWSKLVSTTSWNTTVRALHSWSDLKANKLLAIGTDDSAWVSKKAVGDTAFGTPFNVDPQYYTTDLAVSVTTVSGSADVTINDLGANISSYDSVYFRTPISVNGVILSGLYACKNPSGASGSYTVTATNIIGVPTPATETNLFRVTTIATTGSSPNFIATVVHTPAEIVPVGSIVTFVGAGSFTGPYTVLAGSTAGTFTFNTGTSNLGSASGGTFTKSTALFGAVPTFTSDITPATPTILVTLANHGYSVGSTFSVQVSTVIGGVTLYGDYIVTTLPTADPVNTFTITASSAATLAETVQMNGGEASVIYFIGQQAIPPTGYGTSGYGYFGYGLNIDPASASGRRYTGTTVSTVSGITTVTITGTKVYVTPGTIVQDTATTPNQFTVTSAVEGNNSTFTFTGTPTGTTFTIVTWAFDMPVTSNPPDWSLDNWGEYLLASPHGGEIFVWQPAQNNGHLTVMPNAPLLNEGFFTAMPERQVVAYGSTFTGFQDPLLVRWCDIGNFTSWVGTVTNQAGSYRIPKGSKIVGAMQGPQQGLIWTDLALWSMQYINLPLVYSFNEIAAGCGLIGRKAMGTLAGNVYWMSQSQFFKLSGNGVEPVQCPIWDVIFQDIDTNYWQNVRCAPNSRFGEIAWYYPTIGSNGIPTKYAKYNTLLNQWDFGTLTRTAWIDQSEAGPPIGAGGDLSIYQHETLNSANGTAMNSYFQTGYFAIQEGDLKTFMDQVWPDMKWGLYDGSQNATITITFSTVDYPGDTPKEYSFTVTEGTQFVTPRFRARLVSIKLESNDIDSFWRVGNIRYRYQPDGKF